MGWKFYCYFPLFYVEGKILVQVLNLYFLIFSLLVLLTFKKFALNVLSCMHVMRCRIIHMIDIDFMYCRLSVVFTIISANFMM